MERINTDPLRLFDRNKKQTDALRDMWRGCAGFLVGGGPSLNTIDYSKIGHRGVVSLGINNVAGLVPVRAFIHGDGPSSFHHGIWQDPSIIKLTRYNYLDKKFRIKDGDVFRESSVLVRECPNVFAWYEEKDFSAIDFLNTKNAMWGVGGDAAKKVGLERMYLTMLPAIRMCHYFGLRKLFLVGMDFQMDRDSAYAFKNSNDEKTAAGNNRKYKQVSIWLEKLAPILEHAGMPVLNCNPSSQLKVFPFIDFDDAIRECKSVVPDVFDFAGWYKVGAGKEPEKVGAGKEPEKEVVKTKSRQLSMNRSVIPVFDGCDNRLPVIRFDANQFSPGLSPVFGCSLHGECVITRIARDSPKSCFGCSDKKESLAVPVIGFPVIETPVVRSVQKKTLKKTLRVVTVCVGKKYPRYYVERMRCMLDRHLSIMHSFHCITDNPVSDGDIKVDPLHGWWNKMYMFSDIVPEGRILYLDIDQVIVGDITPMVEFAMNQEFVTHRTRTGWKGSKINSGFLSFDSHGYLDMWNEFIPLQNDLKGMPGGDQVWLQSRIKNNVMIDDEFPNSIVTYKKDISTHGLMPENKIIHFTGRPSQEDVDDQFVKDHWTCDTDRKCPHKGLETRSTRGENCLTRGSVVAFFQCGKFDKETSHCRYNSRQPELVCQECSVWKKLISIGE